MTGQQHARLKTQNSCLEYNYYYYLCTRAKSDTNIAKFSI